MNKNETAKKLLLKADELINMAKGLLNDVEDESECEESDDILANWKEHIAAVNAFYLTIDDEVSSTDCPYPQYIEDFNPYGTYPTKKYAVIAQKMKILNDMILAYKYCYDRDFEADWSTWSGARHYVIYNDNTQKFEANRSATHTNLIYFSSAKIAKACADWLNSFGDTELIV